MLKRLVFWSLTRAMSVVVCGGLVMVNDQLIALGAVAPTPPAEESARGSVPPQPVAEPVPPAPSMPVSYGCCSDGCNYVDGLYSQAYGTGASGCPGCLEDDDDCCFKGPKHPCDLYPHYAYYPRYHGYYYFRPYNYQHVAAHQQFAVCVGIDPRMPYSLAVFERAYAGFPQAFPPGSGPIGSALPLGNDLPQLEELVPVRSPEPLLP